jgi:hypothetical protein
MKEYPFPVWTIDQLPPLKIGDGLAFKAAPGIQEKLIESMGASTWHWALAGQPYPSDEFSGPDYGIIGSIKKGIATELLSEYQCRHMRIYRPVLPGDYQDSLSGSILKRCAYYGNYDYNWLDVTRIPFWYFLRPFGLQWQVLSHTSFYCLQFYNQIWADFDFPLVDGNEPATPWNLENSPQLELVWGTF